MRLKLAHVTLLFIRLSDDCRFFFTFILVVFFVLVIIVIRVFRRQAQDSANTGADRQGGKLLTGARRQHVRLLLCSRTNVGCQADFASRTQALCISAHSNVRS